MLVESEKCALEVSAESQVFVDSLPFASKPNLVVEFNLTRPVLENRPEVDEFPARRISSCTNGCTDSKITWPLAPPLSKELTPARRISLADDPRRSAG